MKTNLSNVMIEVKKDQDELSEIEYYLKGNNTNKSTIELSGNEVVLEEVKDFDEKMERADYLVDRIAYIKSIIEEKNSKTVLSNGLSIAGNLDLLAKLRMRIETYQRLLAIKETKKRVTEVNNSYYLHSVPVFDRKEIETKKKSTEILIQSIELAISKANSVEFEIKDWLWLGNVRCEIYIYSYLNVKKEKSKMQI